MASKGRVVDLDRELVEIFLHDKPARLLVSVLNGKGKKYASIIAKEIDCTYSHCVRLLQKLEKKGLLKFMKNGRIKVVELTDYGKRIAIALQNLFEAFKVP